ncbi:hypothetical protein QRX50_31650 [Amycolatopsis carbonis]|uniref:Uncharacterized protein n=1 Tax=Amycolatopsis carbonis TaxID=715471 RepID=A0A9Y2MPG8_9PSEU|nr:hypothetical protein [Amycolatopsis sp. 2-15]WIX76015.1 hypothetical protein QRX50_31650 [Amycolatopsis sp. 2-15]
MLETYLTFAGNEIANNTRTASYLVDSGAGGTLQGQCFCDTLPDAIDDAPYTTPELDPAPWYDESDPRSTGFAGLWIEKIDGLYNTPIERTITQRIGDGAVRGCLRAKDKTLTVTGWLFAQDECGADYGLVWLRSALLGSQCAGCNGDDLCFLACCPSQIGCRGEGEGEHGEGEGGGEDDCDPVYDTDVQLRTLKNSALVSGPDVVAVAPGFHQGMCLEGARPVYQVTFQISTDPYMWRQPMSVVEAQPWPLPTDDAVCNITWNDLDECDPANPDCLPGSNVPLRGCVADELCPPPPPPPRLPAASAACVCLPLTVVRQCIDIPSNKVPAWLDSALRIEVYSGEAPLRNLSVRVWQNPQDKTAAELDECAALGTYYITYVPANSYLTIDGVTGKSTLRCPGFVQTNASTQVYGSGGGPLEHITLSCGVKHTICADVDTTYIDPLASLTISTITREL